MLQEWKPLITIIESKRSDVVVVVSHLGGNNNCMHPKRRRNPAADVGELARSAFEFVKF